MSVFRVPKVKNYTTMANYHLRDKRLSNKAKGLMSLMLMLPEDWDYTMRGLTFLSTDGITSISASLQELEKNGYLVRRQIHDSSGKFSQTEYQIFEQAQPMSEKPLSEKPLSENPITVKPISDKPLSENLTQINTKLTNTNEQITNSQKTNLSNQPDDPDARMTELREYLDIIHENLDYDILCFDHPQLKPRIDEIIEIMVDAVCSKRPTIRISREEYPQEVVKSRLLKLNKDHIEYVLDCLRSNKTEIRNIRRYLLTMLYQAPTTIDNYYASLVNYHSSQ